MRILHYFLGFPPYRTGGLTKYGFDLMQAQVKRGDTVFALWPGEMKLTSKKVFIRRNRSVSGIGNYELVNPLPVSLDEGIVDFSAYTKSCEERVFIKYLKEVKPDVIHIHTLMGLYREFVRAADRLGIRTVFTSHDYFGICPKVTLYRYGNVCENDSHCRDCVACNQSALSLKKIRIMQSPMYRALKNTKLVAYLRKRHRNTFFAEETLPEVMYNEDEIKDLAGRYRRLRQYYIEMLSSVDILHFNSTLTEEVYKKYFLPKGSRVISITHRDISDNRNSKKTSSSRLRLTYLAPAKPFKGYLIMKRALDELWKEGNHSFSLQMFGSVQELSPYMKVQENGYSYRDLEDIFANTDVLLAPSIWYETFGFTVLEAVSYGVPVIVSNHVGAKDIVGEGGMIVEAGNVDAIKNAILDIDSERIDKMRNNIKNAPKVKSFDTLVDETYELYR